MSGAARKQAPRLARPAARYWKGKAPKGVADVPSDSDEGEESEVEGGDVLIGGEQDIVEEDDDGVPLRRDPVKAVKAMNVSLKDVNISRDGKVTVAGRGESGRTAMEEDGKYPCYSTLRLLLMHFYQNHRRMSLK
jgi:microfibrillar-associated protein 1